VVKTLSKRREGRKEGRASTANMRRWGFRLVLAAVIAIGLGYVPYRTYGPGGIGRITNLRQQLDTLEKKNAQIARHNGSLLHQVRKLKQDRNTWERVARDELGLVRAGDLIFQFDAE
jgi:cell division protein FtsB